MTLDDEALDLLLTTAYACPGCDRIRVLDQCEVCDVRACRDCGRCAGDCGFVCHWCDDEALADAPIPDTAKTYHFAIQRPNQTAWRCPACHKPIVGDADYEGALCDPCEFDAGDPNSRPSIGAA